MNLIDNPQTMYTIRQMRGNDDLGIGNWVAVQTVEKEGQVHRLGIVTEHNGKFFRYPVDVTMEAGEKLNKAELARQIRQKDRISK